MKKKSLLFTAMLLFASSFLFSCSDDGDPIFDNWNNAGSPNYKQDGYNPVLGEWLRSDEMLKFEFTSDFEVRQFQLVGSTTWSKLSAEKYAINDKAFKMLNLLNDAYSVYGYSIAGDSVLEITYPVNNRKMTFYRLK